MQVRVLRGALWARSSIGRAPDLCSGQRQISARLHVRLLPGLPKRAPPSVPTRAIFRRRNMSIILETAAGKAIKLNAWNWGVLNLLVASAGIFTEELWAPKRVNGGGELELADALCLADFLE